MKKQYIIPIFVPHRGCPHDCVFCNQRIISGQYETATLNSIESMIEEYLATMPDTLTVRKEIAFYGGSFTAIPRIEQEQLLHIAGRYISQGRIDGIRISTRPDYIDTNTLQFLHQRGVCTIELGVQSLDTEVLRTTRRHYNQQSVERAVTLIRNFHFSLGLQMMLGLPGDTYGKSLSTAREIARLEPDFVRIYPTVVVEQTTLATWYQHGEYLPLQLDEAVRWAADILLIMEKANIPVIRIGLQPTEDLVMGRQVIAGPYHPAFRELVENDIAYRMLKQLLYAFPKAKNVTFLIHPKDMSIVRGQKGINMLTIRNQFDLEDIKIIVEDQLQRGEIILAEVNGQAVEAMIRKAELV